MKDPEAMEQNKNFDEKAIEDYIVKLSGKASLPAPLELGRNYLISIRGSITTETKADRFDGGVIKTWRFEPILVELVNDEGKTIKARDTRRRSVQLRSALWKIWRDIDSKEDFEEFYDAEMLKIIKDILFE